MKVKPYEVFSKVYDYLMNPEFYKKYLRFIKMIIRKHKIHPKKILDVACGTGKLAKMLKNEGFEVTGIDSSPEMIKIAKKRGIKCYLMSMENFKLNEKFDMIISTYDSVNYLSRTKLRKFVRNAYFHLNESGVLIFDINSSKKIINKLQKRGTMFFSTNNFDVVWISGGTTSWISKIIIYEHVKGNLYRKYVEIHREYIHDTSFIIDTLKSVGFKRVFVYSDFKLKNRCEGNRIFFVARK